MLQLSTSKPQSAPRALLQRVVDAIASLAGDRVWARSSGPHVLLGLRGDDCYARVTPLGNGSFGLAFRAVEARSSHTNAWEPLFLVDDLASIVEHALVAVDAIAIDA
ncbi:MAG TPA: hypothetical protein VGG39_07080 [Polyangiaceae bacterium]|jgi:hypothetical protein